VPHSGNRVMYRESRSAPLALNAIGVLSSVPADREVHNEG